MYNSTISPKLTELCGPHSPQSSFRSLPPSPTQVPSGQLAISCPTSSRRHPLIRCLYRRAFSGNFVTYLSTRRMWTVQPSNSALSVSYHQETYQIGVSSNVCNIYSELHNRGLLNEFNFKNNLQGSENERTNLQATQLIFLWEKRDMEKCSQ